MITLHSATLLGISGIPVSIETDIAAGLPHFIVVGLPDTGIQEARERVRAAIKNSGFPFPRSRVTVNLAPADVKKEGPRYDLPIAISILHTSGLIECSQSKFDDAVFLGELALDGTVRSVPGVLPLVLEMQREGFQTVYVPEENADEAALVENITIIPVPSLLALVDHLSERTQLPAHAASPITALLPASAIDFSHIQGQQNAKRALEVAAAGAHNVLMSGPPGAGKTLLARALPSILPSLTQKEIIEITALWSIAGLLPPRELIRSRPFRAPHHSASATALIGGGSSPRPGEISLAHRGVLFLDEFPEFLRHVLEHLRQPLEDGTVTVARASGVVTFPARFMLVAAQNPCPCGFQTDPTRSCTCSATSLANYQKKISGPIVDRIDVTLELPPVHISSLAAPSSAESSEIIRARIENARERQRHRFTATPFHTNTEITAPFINRFCKLTDASQTIVVTAADRLHLSARGYHRLLKLSRTIADLSGEEIIQESHVAEALQYRMRVAA